LGQGFDNQAHLPAQWLGIAALVVVVGAGLVWVATRARKESPLSES